MLASGLAQAAGWLGVLGAYVALGGVVGVLLQRTGQPATMGLSALVVWPLLLPTLQKPTEPPPQAILRDGPRAEQITLTFAAATRALADGPEVAGGQRELDALQRALERTDARLAWVDALLETDAGPGAEEDLARLQAARNHAVGEADAVLAGVSQLRLQIGLAALSELRGEGTPAVQDRLRELHARVQVIEELGAE